MAEFQPKAHIRRLTEQVHMMLVKDLKAMNTEQLSASPAGVGRNPLHIAAECAAVNHLLAEFIRNKQRPPRPSPEEREAHLRSFDTLDKALAYLAQETKHLLDVVDELDENILGDTTDALFGRPMSWFAIAEFGAMHMMYHDGQLNYIHTLYGDNEIHWWKD